MGFGIHYGRRELGSVETKASLDDVPIKPGETYVYSFSEVRVLNWERFRQRENKPDAKKLILYFQILSFGDATGFVGNNGLAVPRPPNERSSLERCEPEPYLSGPGGMEGQHALVFSGTEFRGCDWLLRRRQVMFTVRSLTNFNK